MFSEVGYHDPLRELSVRKFCSLLLGFLLKDKTTEQRKDLHAALEGKSSKAVDESVDRKLAETYAADGMNPFRIKMMEELRHEDDPVRRSKIRLKYMGLAKEAREAQDG